MENKFLHFNEIPLMARILGFAGLIPFFAGGTIIWAPIDLSTRLGLMEISISYATLICSFLGGVRWGANMEKKEDFIFVLSVLPTLLAFACLFFPTPLAIGLLTIIFLALGVIDMLDARRNDVARWYGALRLWLTLGASASLASMGLWFMLTMARS